MKKVHVVILCILALLVGAVFAVLAVLMRDRRPSVDTMFTSRRATVKLENGVLELVLDYMSGGGANLKTMYCSQSISQGVETQGIPSQAISPFKEVVGTGGIVPAVVFLSLNDTCNVELGDSEAPVVFLGHVFDIQSESSRITLKMHLPLDEVKASMLEGMQGYATTCDDSVIVQQTCTAYAFLDPVPSDVPESYYEMLTQWDSSEQEKWCKRRWDRGFKKTIKKGEFDQMFCTRCADWARQRHPEVAQTCCVSPVWIDTPLMCFTDGATSAEGGCDPRSDDQTVQNIVDPQNTATVWASLIAASFVYRIQRNTPYALAYEEFAKYPYGSELTVEGEVLNANVNFEVALGGFAKMSIEQEYGYAVLTSPADNLYVASWRGSIVEMSGASYNDWSVNLSSELVDLEDVTFGSQTLSIKAHAGYLGVAQNVYLEPIVQAFADGKTVVLTGHSKGAGVCCVTGLLLILALLNNSTPENEINRRLRVIGYATPQCFGASQTRSGGSTSVSRDNTIYAISDAMPDVFHNFTHDLDIVAGSTLVSKSVKSTLRSTFSALTGNISLVLVQALYGTIRRAMKGTQEFDDFVPFGRTYFLYGPEQFDDKQVTDCVSADLANAKLRWHYGRSTLASVKHILSDFQYGADAECIELRSGKTANQGTVFDRSGNAFGQTWKLKSGHTSSLGTSNDFIRLTGVSNSHTDFVCYSDGTLQWHNWAPAVGYTGGPTALRGLLSRTEDCNSVSPGQIIVKSPTDNEQINTMITMLTRPLVEYNLGSGIEAHAVNNESYSYLAFIQKWGVCDADVVL